jgi:4'-phosphopantetheinyl transferase
VREAFRGGFVTWSDDTAEEEEDLYDRDRPAMITMPRTAAQRTLAEFTADVWVVEIAGIDDGMLGESVLDDAERMRAAKFAPGAVRGRVRYVAAHVALRHVLSSYVGRLPAELQFGRARCPRCDAPHGRPILVGPQSTPHFSLSHSGEYALVGVAAHPIGVDVESVPVAGTVDAVVGRLHPAERAEIQSSAPEDRPRAFARIWCRKEAYLKAVGIGVVADLTADYVGPNRSPHRPHGVTIADVPVAVDVGAVAVLAPDYDVRADRFKFQRC